MAHAQPLVFSRPPCRQPPNRAQEPKIRLPRWFARQALCSRALHLCKHIALIKSCRIMRTDVLIQIIESCRFRTLLAGTSRLSAALIFSVLSISGQRSFATCHFCLQRLVKMQKYAGFQLSRPVENGSLNYSLRGPQIQKLDKNCKIFMKSQRNAKVTCSPWLILFFAPVF